MTPRVWAGKHFKFIVNKTNYVDCVTQDRKSTSQKRSDERLVAYRHELMSRHIVYV